MSCPVHHVLSPCVVLGAAKKREVRTITASDLGPPTNKAAASVLQQQNGQQFTQSPGQIIGRPEPAASLIRKCVHKSVL